MAPPRPVALVGAARLPMRLRVAEAATRQVRPLDGASSTGLVLGVSVLPGVRVTRPLHL